MLAAFAGADLDAPFDAGADAPALEDPDRPLVLDPVGRVDFGLSPGDSSCDEPYAYIGEHALIRSAEPGEEWAWCYPDSLFLLPAGS